MPFCPIHWIVKSKKVKFNITDCSAFSWQKNCSHKYSKKFYSLFFKVAKLCLQKITSTLFICVHSLPNSKYFWRPFTISKSIWFKIMFITVMLCQFRKTPMHNLFCSFVEANKLFILFWLFWASWSFFRSLFWKKYFTSKVKCCRAFIF